MTASQTQIQRHLQNACAGDPEALGELIQRHRGYLKVLAERALDEKFQARLDASDVVQRTCLAVHNRIAEFRGDTPEAFLAWIRRIHDANLLNVLREHLAQKRDVTRDGELVESLIADALQSTPSQRVLRDEKAVQLTEALEALPSNQRKSVRLRYLEGLPIQQIAKTMDRSEKATSQLIMRGLAALKKRLAHPSED